ncbi:hypothetical protein GGQ95_003735 [Anoxybacillus rupiensis]|nr:hypothetical protein [Anoxybacillus rupiensis]
MFQKFGSKWLSEYSREVPCWANELDVFLTFMAD